MRKVYNMQYKQVAHAQRHIIKIENGSAAVDTQDTDCVGAGESGG